MRLLEADLTSLSLAASKATGGVFGGMFSTTSGPLDPDVVHAAETALVALKGQHRSITSDPNFTKASDVREKAFVAALSACDSKHAHVVLCGLQYAHGLVLTTTVSVGNLTALAECMGKQTETTARDDGDDKTARDALVRRAQILLAIAERAPCFGVRKQSEGVGTGTDGINTGTDGTDTDTDASQYLRFAMRLANACFALVLAAYATRDGSSDRQNNGTVVAAEAAAFRVVELIFVSGAVEAAIDDRASNTFDAGDTDRTADGTNDAGDTDSTTNSDSNLFSAFPKTQVALALFRKLCDVCKGSKSTPHDASTSDTFTAHVSTRFAFDALASALVAPDDQNVFRAFSRNRTGVESIKRNLVTALVSSVFSTAGPPGASSKRGGSMSPSKILRANSNEWYSVDESLEKIADGRSAIKCAGAFLKFARARRGEGNTKERSATDATGATTKKDVPRNTPGEFSGSSSSSFFSWITSPSKGAAVWDESQRDDEAVDASDFDTRDTNKSDTTSDTPNDTFAAERFLFLGSFASSLESEMAPWRRSAALDVLRGTYFPITTFRRLIAHTRLTLLFLQSGVAMDPRALRDAYGHASNLPGHTNNAFQDVTRILARVARAGVSVEEIYDDDDAGVVSVPSRVACAFRDAAFGSRGASSHARGPVDDQDDTGQIAHAVFLALDGVLAICFSLETLVLVATRTRDERELRVARDMLCETWVVLQSTLCTAFQKVPGEAATLELCRGYQALTRACAACGIEEAKDACFVSLCAFATAGLGQVACDGNFSTGSNFGGSKTDSAFSDSARKSTHAFRALLNVAQALIMTLGHRGWFSVLETTRRLEACVSETDDAREERHPARKTDQIILETLLASSARLFAASADLGFSESMDALEACRGSSCRELDDFRREVDDWERTHDQFASKSVLRTGSDSQKSKSNSINKTKKLTALTRFVDAVVVRVAGTSDAYAAPFWATLEQHFEDVLDNEKNHSIASMVCAQLNRGVVLGLEGLPGDGGVQSADEPTNANPSQASQQKDFASAKCSLANRLSVSRLLAPLVRTAKHAKSVHARVAAVEAIVFLIRERGDLFTQRTHGWGSALHALRAAAEDEDGDARGKKKVGKKNKSKVVAAGWSAVAVVVSDILPSLVSRTNGGDASGNTADAHAFDPMNALDAAVPLVAAYASQSHDTRASLGAVNAVWNACDFFGRLFSDARNATFFKSATFAERFLLPAFAALAVVSLDQRSDVRHSALNTLANVLASHSGKLSGRAFREATVGIFFPLLRDIDDTANRVVPDTKVDVAMDGDIDDASDDESDSLGTDRGTGNGAAAGTVGGDALTGATVGATGTTTGTPTTTTGTPTTLLVHHSRDTVGKQWDETKAVALAGVAKLVRQKAAALLLVPGFCETWRRVCFFIAKAVTAGSSETASTALATARVSGVKFAMLAVGVETHVGYANSFDQRDNGTVEKPTPETEGPSFRNAKIVPSEVRELSKVLFNTVLGTYDLCAKAAQLSSSPMSAKTRLEIAKSLHEVFQNARASFDANDVETVLKICDCLLRNPEPFPEWFRGETAFETAGETPAEMKQMILAFPVSKQNQLKATGQGYDAYNTQKSSLALLVHVFSNLTNDAVDDGAYRVIAERLLRYIKESTEISKGDSGILELVSHVSRDALDSSALDSATQPTNQPPATQPGAMSFRFGAATCVAFGKLVASSTMPGDDLSQVFELAVAVLGNAMLLRGRCDGGGTGDPSSALWKAACRAFHFVIQKGLPAVKKWPSASGGLDGSVRIWLSLATTFESFVLRDRCFADENTSGTTEKELAETEQLDRDTLRVLRDVLLSKLGTDLDADVVERLVDVFAGGVDSGFSLAEVSRLSLTSAEVSRLAKEDSCYEKHDEFSVTSSEESTQASQNAFPIQCLLNLRDLAVASQVSTKVAKHAVPALLAKCESSLRRYSAETVESDDSDDLVTSAARACVAASALAKVLKGPNDHSSQPPATGWFRKETPFSIFENQCTPEYRAALRDALGKCVGSSHPRLADEAHRALDALNEFEN